MRTHRPAGRATREGSGWRCLGVAFGLSSAAACDRRPCGEGPEVFDAPAEHPDPSDKDDDWLFDPLRINRIDLTLDADAEEILSAERLFSEPRFEVRGDVTIDGQSIPDVGLRLRGGLGSFQRYDEKPQWRLDFNEYVEDRRFHGLEALCLNNADEDPSYLADWAGMEVYRLAGSPAARVGYAQLFVNGEDKGLTIVVEDTDDRWLKRVFDENDGNLYDGSYLYNGWTPYRLDLGEGRDGDFPLEEGEEVGGADLAPLSQAVQTGSLRELSERVDMRRLHATLAAEWYLGNADGYGSFSNNYRLYLPPEGPAVLAPWDMGSAFPAEGRDEGIWDEPAGNLAALCFADPDCLGEQEARRAGLEETVREAGLAEGVAAVRARIRTGAELDPWGACDPGAVESAQRRVVGWFAD